MDRDSLKLIAFYLPQFHPIPENDRFWGKGFTEWTNVSKAAPLFPGHYQPRLPADLGFYDLRLAEVREAQAELARQSGIHAFCYYYYWFNGRRLLERPLDEVLRSGRPDFPFCICWANENWTRRWDGAEEEVLVSQEHSVQSDLAFIRDLVPLMEDPRYVRVAGGRPLILIYRANALPEPLRTTDTWRDECIRRGLGEPYLCCAETFGLRDGRLLGFDASVEFPPHGLVANAIEPASIGCDADFKGYLHDYDEAVLNSLAKRPPNYRLFRTVVPGWDNTPRRGKAGTAFLRSTPDSYELWLRVLADRTRRTQPEDLQLLFVNAWNEWAEGAYLEPDQKYGTEYLEATQRALRGNSKPAVLVRMLREGALEGDYGKRELLDELEGAVLARERTIDKLVSLVQDRFVIDDVIEPVVLSPVVPAPVAGRPTTLGGLFHVDRLGTTKNVLDVTIDRRYAVPVVGWAFVPDHGDADGVVAVLSKLDTAGVEPPSYFVELKKTVKRADVTERYGPEHPGLPERCGFEAIVSFRLVPDGVYRFGILQCDGDTTFLDYAQGTVVVA